MLEDSWIFLESLISMRKKKYSKSTNFSSNNSIEQIKLSNYIRKHLLTIFSCLQDDRLMLLLKQNQIINLNEINFIFRTNQLNAKM